MSPPRTRALLAAALATLTALAGCSGKPEAGAGPLQIAADGGTVSQFAPADGKPWIADFAIDLCVDPGHKATLRSLQVNGKTTNAESRVTGHIHDAPNVKDGGFMSMDGPPEALVKRFGGKLLKLDGATVTRSCDDTGTGYIKVIMTVDVPITGYTIKTYGLTYESDGKTHTTEVSNFALIACGTRQDRKQCTPTAETD